MNYANLNGRTAVVTGAASGMGAATAELLAANGARVALLARRADRLAEITEKINANGGDAVAVPVDVTAPASVDNAAERVRRELGAVDLVVNSAGVMLANPIEDGRTDEWDRMIDTNLSGVLRTTRAFVPDLVAAAESGRSADLVNISSIGAHVNFPSFAVYGATKAAVVGLLTSLPMFFSGIVFIRSFAAAERKDAALGANLMGALVGGRAGRVAVRLVAHEAAAAARPAGRQELVSRFPKSARLFSRFSSGLRNQERHYQVYASSAVLDLKFVAEPAAENGTNFKSTPLDGKAFSSPVANCPAPARSPSWPIPACCRRRCSSTSSTTAPRRRT